MNLNTQPAPAADVRERRRALGLTQQQLAHEADCSLAHLQLLERGYRPDASAVLPRVLNVLDGYAAAEAAT